MSSTTDVTSIPFDYSSGRISITEEYLAPRIVQICRKLGPQRVLDLGCGNGAVSRALAELDAVVVGCDPSEQGIQQARQRVPKARFHVLGVYDDPSRLGEAAFDIVVCTEVVEHLTMPRALPRFARRALRPGGYLVVSTVYHGYLKNLLLSLCNKWDTHWTPFWDGGHIKLWSRKTLTKLLADEGFEVIGFSGAGRLPWLWRSMILTARLK